MTLNSAAAPSGFFRKPVSLLIIALALMLLGGCSTVRMQDAEEGKASEAQAKPAETAPAQPAAEASRDPWEGFNRAMYTFNDKFDRYLAKPVAKGYQYVLPEF